LIKQELLGQSLTSQIWLDAQIKLKKQFFIKLPERILIAQNLV